MLEMEMAINIFLVVVVTNESWLPNDAVKEEEDDDEGTFGETLLPTVTY